jgi:histidyl-tRNA synthetase
VVETAPSAKSRFTSPPGTRDLLAPEARRQRVVVDRFFEVARLAGFEEIALPLLEDVGVFARGIGEGSDVVRKEMYELRDRGGRHLALRPELTAQVVRAFVEHRPALPWTVAYAGPCFRYERPQAGRYRQFHQVGVEALGTEDPAMDTEVVALASSVLETLGLGGVRLRLGSLGDEVCRPAYRAALVAYLLAHQDELCDEHRGRVEENPMRILDCKRDACRGARAGAPAPLDHLCEPCLDHFQAVQRGLAELGIVAEVDPWLVRGLDYYVRTTFELSSPALSAAQDALGGGGRYDRLAEELGGPPTPGIGFSMGVERLLLALAQAGSLPEAPAVDVFVVDLTGGGEATVLAHELRAQGLATARAFDARSPKAQFRAADRSGASWAAIVGPEEQSAGTVALRPLRAPGGQFAVERASVAKRLAALVSAPGSRDGDPEHQGEEQG